MSTRSQLALLSAANDELERRLSDEIRVSRTTREALRRSEDRYRELVNLSQDAIYVMDENGIYVLTNPAGCALLGYTEQELLGMPVANSYLPEERAAFAERLGQLKIGKGMRFERMALRKDGTTVPVEVSLSPMSHRHCQAVVRDISKRWWNETEHQRRDEALRQFRIAMDAAKDAIYLIDRATMKYIDVNEAACRTWGLSREEMFALGPHGVRGQARETLEREYDALIAAGGRAAPIEIRLRRKDGTQFTIELERSAQRSGDGWTIVAVARDITQKKRAEEELRASEDRLKLALEGVGDGVWDKDLQTGKIVYSKRYCEIFGLAESESDNRQWEDRVHPEDMPSVRANRQEHFEGETPLFSSEHRMRCKDGSWKWILARGIVVRRSEDGVEQRFIGTVTDITERKSSERRIARLTRMYATLSHANEAMARARSESALFANICRVAVDQGGMRQAEVRIADEGAKTLNPVAYSGAMNSVVANFVASTDPARPGYRSPAAIAYRENRVLVVNDLAADDPAAPWVAVWRAAGVGSLAALPLRRGGKPIGTFILNAEEKDFFDAELSALLDRLTIDLEYVLGNFEHERRRKRTELVLRESEQRFRGLVEQAIAGIYVIEAGRLSYVNPKLAEIVGYTPEELIGQPLTMLVAKEEQTQVAENIRKGLSGEARSSQYAFTGRRKDGSRLTIGLHGTRATIEGRPVIIGLAQDITEKQHAQEQIRHYVALLEDALMSTVRVATTLCEMRDPYTAGHQRRVAELAVAIGSELGFDVRRQEGIRVAGYLYDIGKITIPTDILTRPGKLSAMEFRLTQSHTRAGYDVLAEVKFPWPVAEVALQHHERMDGSGYPQGLKGEAIRLESRIVAVADVVAAMSAHRPYRASMGLDTALAEIERGRGTAYDADVADACLRLFRDQGYKLPD